MLHELGVMTPLVPILGPSKLEDIFLAAAAVINANHSLYPEVTE
jgi:hypothetical protein